jgi:hypothetical protein
MLSGVSSGIAYQTLDSPTVLIAMVVDELLLLVVMGELTDRIPDVAVLYSLDSCGYLSATANCQGTVQEQFT